ncbi:MAG: acyl-CoA dehydrogenase family protein [bacterium]|nr:acyl-CoA dehydrogenase family protein [bacterium]
MDKFRGVDYYNIEDLLTDEERMSRDMTRQFVDEQVMPIIKEHFRNGTFPRHLIPVMGAQGLFGSNLKGYGCAGISNIAYGLNMQELERGDSGIRSCASVQGALVMYPIYTFGNETQKTHWLPKLVTGEAIGCFGLTEPDHGSDPENMTTTAKKVAGGFALNGTKRWITNGTIADIAIVWAKLDGVIRGFLIEKGTTGFSAPEMHDKWSMRASITSELILENCLIPEANILPKTDGLKSALMCLTQARYGIAWGVIGSAKTCYQKALDYAKSCIRFNKPIASFQLIQDKLVNMLQEITKAELLALRLGQLKDTGEMKHTQVSLAKRNNVAAALDIARTARGILGANGITDEYPIGRHIANLETVITYEGTHEIHTLIIGRDITGISALE